MNELRRIHAVAARLRAHGHPFALATLVKVEGSAYRHPGARIVLGPDGATTGIISGGCLEREIAHHAAGVLRSGEPALLRLSAARGEDLFGPGAGCGGTVHILLQRILPDTSQPNAIDLLARVAGGDAPHALATVFRADGALAAEMGRHLLVHPAGAPCGDVADAALRRALTSAGERALADRRTATVALPLAGGEAEALVECVLSPVRLVVFGGGPDVDALLRQAAAVGWHPVAVGTRPVAELRAAAPAAAEWVRLVHAEEVAERVRLTARTAAVVATHNYVRDRALVAGLLASPAAYVGVIGSRQRFRDLRRELARGEAPLAGRSRLFGPAGLDLGAETPEEIALAVVAEAHAVLAGRSARQLRNLGRRRAAPA